MYCFKWKYLLKREHPGQSWKDQYLNYLARWVSSDETMATVNNQRKQNKKGALRRGKSCHMPYWYMFMNQIQTRCFYSGELFDNDLTLERKDNDIGYQVGNVIPIKGIYNEKRKNFATVEEITKHAELLDRRIDAPRQTLIMCESRLKKHKATLRKSWGHGEKAKRKIANVEKEIAEIVSLIAKSEYNSSMTKQTAVVFEAFTQLSRIEILTMYTRGLYDYCKLTSRRNKLKPIN